MRFSLALAVVFLPAIVNAQYGKDDSPSSSSASAAVPSAPPSTSTNIKVDVAPGGDLSFSPANFNATNGTTVTFFFPRNAPHSVTQSTFANPCTYLAAGSGSSSGFDTGVQTATQFSIMVLNDQHPVWFFCKVSRHCSRGMVGSINAPSTGANTAAAFLTAAKAIGANEQTLSDNGPVTGGVSPVASVTPAATVGSPASSPSSSSSSGAGRLVASGVFALLVTVLGITLA